MTGVFAAVATPLTSDGRLDPGMLDQILAFLVEAGVDGVCVGGATSEYPRIDLADRVAIIARAAERLPSDRALLVGIGAPSLQGVLDLGRASIQAGARALLVPMPMFFRYEQQDLREYCAHVSRTLRAPCLLYDLPDFTNPLALDTAIDLLSTEEFIVGLKDSSGRRDNLEACRRARGDRPWTLLVGDDRLLLAGLEAGWSGAISGVAGFCPELLVALCRSFDRGREAEAARLQGLLDELIRHMAVLPAPWAVKAGLAARGLDTGPYALPLTAERRDQIAGFGRWFGAWIETTELASRASTS